MRLLVEMLEPYEGHVYDPCCGSAGLFVQSKRFVEAHGGQKTDISIFGQESNPTTWRLAHMNLAIRGIEANLGSQPADTFLRNLHPDLRADYILANGIPACLWFLTRNKTGKNFKHGGRDRSGETLFIDARKLGTMQARTLRVLTDADIDRIAGIYRAWRGAGEDNATAQGRQEGHPVFLSASAPLR